VGKAFSCFFSPLSLVTSLVTKRPKTKNAIKKSIKNKNKASYYFFLAGFEAARLEGDASFAGCGKCVSLPSTFFHAPPCTPKTFRGMEAPHSAQRTARTAAQPSPHTPLARMHPELHQPPTTPCIYISIFSPVWSTSHFVAAGRCMS
jgi:hypothetical protein